MLLPLPRGTAAHWLSGIRLPASPVQKAFGNVETHPEESAGAGASLALPTTPGTPGVSMSFCGPCKLEGLPRPLGMWVET